jgi:hypothetical protein
VLTLVLLPVMYQLFTALMERFAPRISALIAARARFAAR